ncbi:hypothetical protein [Microbispora sp. ATCC PTA-5024]|uniref:hypothetical protein n=1 Tax=Microbispora sp. ATCC PTA-5024 TaxID=316330 RepID=UPI0003DC22C6|nr:hypothetical protein [Microbispora sp. ATCC PTA-5024]ETK31060.1 hypothetical protein MPTA5024_37035 [Microbispora sp. ATCC PTA-5024]
MSDAVFIAAFVISGAAIGVLGVLVFGIHYEESRKSVTGEPPGPFSRTTRRVLGLSVDHTACRYVTNPQYRCPVCRQSEVNEHERQ